MPNRTYRITEIVGTSNNGIDDAIRNGSYQHPRPCTDSIGSRSSRCVATSTTDRSVTSR